MKLYFKRRHRAISIQGRIVPVFSEEIEGGLAYFIEGSEEDRQALMQTGLLADGAEPIVQIPAADDTKASIDFSSAKREDKPIEMPDEYVCPKHRKVHSKKQPAAYFACYEAYAKSLGK